jgi:hypothetical protein
MFDIELTQALDELDAMIKEAGVKPSHNVASSVCLMTRRIHMLVVHRANYGGESWNERTAKALEKVFQSAIQATAGSIFERNIAIRASFLSRLIQESLPRKKRGLQDEGFG